MAGVACHDGADGLAAVLARSEILVTLLPDTPATANILNADTLAQLPRGACIINPGRGTLIDDDALLAALGPTGRVPDRRRHAPTCSAPSPCPRITPTGPHPKVTVTPHIAAATRAKTASDVIARNIARVESGQRLLHEVSRSAGY